jgi:hypothetical protein
VAGDFWISRARGVGGVILMQFRPFADTNALAFYDGFERGVTDCSPRAARHRIARRNKSSDGRTKGFR